MKIALLSASAPLSRDACHSVIDALATRLQQNGHKVEMIYIPFENNADSFLDQMLSFRLINLASIVDRLITFQPPSYVVPHPNKVVWLTHHAPISCEASGLGNQQLANTTSWHGIMTRLMHADLVGLGEARAVFAGSRAINEKLKSVGQLASEVLYPPVDRPERFRNSGYGDQIVAIAGGANAREQLLVVDAMRQVRTPVCLCLCGGEQEFSNEVLEAVARVEPGRIILRSGGLSEELLENALALNYLPSNTTFHDYSVLEAACASKPSIVFADSDWSRDFISDGETGLIVDATPQAVAKTFDMLWGDRAAARRLGESAHAEVITSVSGWDAIMAKLLA